MKRDKRLIAVPTDHHLLGSVLAALRPLGLPTYLATSENDAGRPRLPGVAVLWDRVAFEGPLRALLDAAQGIGGDILVLAADLPRLETEFILRLMQRAEEHPQAWAVVPEEEGRLQPLCALYRAPIWPKLQACVETGQRSLIDALDSLPPDALLRWPCRGEASLRNWNHPEDRQADSGTTG